MSDWQAPIDFYGKVVDESGAAIVGADVELRWDESPFDNDLKTSSRQSDAEGLFSLLGAQGRILAVAVSKPGYHPSRSASQSFRYSLRSEVFLPDPQNPVIFHLRKKGQGTELITSDNGIRPNLAIRVPKDGTPVRVDLFQKQASATGSVEISQNKPPFREATEWSFRLSIPTGGFAENQDEFQFEAPDTNYVPTVEYRFRKSETNWITQVTKQFYITFGQPRKFGWLRIESDLAQETVFFTYAINPSGSQKLESPN